MRDAMKDGELVVAGPDAPEVATCPDCGHEVHLRSRKTMDKTITWFYRHTAGARKNCRRRYHPVRR